MHLATLSSNENVLPHLLSMPAAMEALLIANKAHQTPLHMAAARGITKDLSLLLVAADAVKMVDKQGRTPQRVAEQYRHSVRLQLRRLEKKEHEAIITSEFCSSCNHC